MQSNQYSQTVFFKINLRCDKIISKSKVKSDQDSTKKDKI